MNRTNFIYKLMFHPADTISLCNYFSWCVTLRSSEAQERKCLTIANSGQLAFIWAGAWQTCCHGWLFTGQLKGGSGRAGNRGGWGNGGKLSIHKSLPPPAAGFASSCSSDRLCLTRNASSPSEEFYITVRAVSWEASVSQTLSLLSCAPGPGPRLVRFAAGITHLF